MEKKKRDRNRRIEFYVEENEYAFIKEKMKRSGISNMSLYMRMVAMRSKVEINDYSELKKLNKELSAIGRNINQIAVRVNSTDNIYEEDIDELKKKMGEIWQLLRSTQSALH